MSRTHPHNRLVHGAGPDAGFARRPPEQRLDMPAQPLVTRLSKPERETDGRWRFLFILAGAVSTTTAASQAMLAGFAPGGVNALEWAAVILFFFNFGWLATAALTGFAGTVSLLFAPKIAPPSKALPDKGHLTAIIIALYQRSPRR